MTNKEMYLRDALNAANQLEKLKDELLVTVSGARRNGASWAEIGGAVGMTKQAAQQRWGKLTPAPLKATDELAADDGQTPATPSIFLEAPAPTADVTSWENTPGYAGYAGDVRQTGYLEASKILDAPAPAKATKPSKKVDAPAPATEPYQDNRPAFWLASAGTIDGTAQPGTGKGPHQCPRCGCTNHKSSIDEVRAYFDCTPTKYDPQDITDYLTRTGHK